MLMKGSVNSAGFEQWLEQWLCKELRPNSTLIMDNAPTNKVRPRAKLWTQQMLCIAKTDLKKLPSLKNIKCYSYPSILLILIRLNTILLP